MAYALPILSVGHRGMEVPGYEGYYKRYVLRLRNLLYGLKQASTNWYDMLKKGLEG